MKAVVRTLPKNQHCFFSLAKVVGCHLLYGTYVKQVIWVWS